MFVWSFRMSRRELIIFGVGLALFVVAIACLLIFPPAAESSSLLVDSGYTLKADTPESRVQFLSQFGWEIETEPLAVKEVIIPVKFDEVYSQYAQLQSRQGFNLQALSGKRAKLWTYKVTNYPGANGAVLANILVKDGVVVGGDISAAAADGFMHGFDPNLFAAETAAMQSAQQTIDRTVPDSIPANSEVPPEPDDL
ncbi:MAG: DUF4830 domain-containing protein [Ruminococcaceae bacterium]|nr:DUF4830 domain-containing protein [Oscillospiraceae bacterium]